MLIDGNGRLGLKDQFPVLAAPASLSQLRGRLRRARNLVDGAGLLVAGRVIAGSRPGTALRNNITLCEIPHSGVGVADLDRSGADDFDIGVSTRSSVARRGDRHGGASHQSP
jgi:hypothetical protein